MITIKARTHRPIFRGFAAESVVESAVSIPELADYTTHSVIVGRLPLLNMLNVLNPLESADGNRPTIAVGQQEISPIGALSMVLHYCDHLIGSEVLRE